MRFRYSRQDVAVHGVQHDVAISAGIRVKTGVT